MKTLNEMIGWAMAWTAMLALALTTESCSDSGEDDGPSSVSFPEKTSVTVNAGEEKTLTFSADANWTLTSSASWCRFVDGDFVETTISGGAGDQSVVIRVTDANQNYETDDVAEITMKMGDKTQVIYEVSRPRKGASALVVKDENGKEISAENPLLVKGGNITAPVETTVTLEFDDANASLGVLTTKSASWVTVTSATEGYEISFNEENTDGKNPKYPIPVEEGGVITFAAQKDGKTLAETAVPIYYEGYAEDALAMEPTFMGITVSVDGQSLTGEGGISGSETTDYGSELISTVTTRNDEFEIVEFTSPVLTDDGEMEGEFDFSANGDLDWVTTTKIQGESGVEDRVKLTVSAMPEEMERRHATVMVFPKAVYDEIKDNLKANIIDGETNDIQSRYTSYIMADLTQEIKSEEPEEGVSFVGYYYTNYDGEAMAMTFDELIGQGMGLEPKMENISDTPEGEAIFDEYGLSVFPTCNVWKVTVPATMMSDENNRLGIQAVGITTESIGQAFSVSGLTGEEVDGVPTSSGQTVSLWTVYLTDGGKPSGYQIICVDERTQIMSAVCVVEITD